MSLKAIIWVMEEAPVEDQGELAVLYALADRANDDGTTAYPSQAWIAHRARCTDRTVRNILRKLELRGVIKKGNPSFVEHIRKDRRPTVWDLNLHMQRPENSSDRKVTTARPESHDSTTGKSRQHDRKPVSDEPSVNPPEPSMNRPWESLRDWSPTVGQWQKLKEKHEGKDIEVELEKFRDWHIEKKSKYKDWNRAFDNWLKRARPSRQQLPEVDYVAAYGLEDAPF